MNHHMIEDKASKLVAEFIRSFGASLDVRLWMKLVLEEVVEVGEAWHIGDREAILKETIDVLYVTTGWNLMTTEAVDDLLPDEEKAAFEAELSEIIRGFEHICDPSVFTPEQLHEALLRVHASNISKLGDDGKPIKREDGKILKGPNYKEPDLSDLV